MHASDPRLILPEPPAALKALSHELRERLLIRQQQQGFLSFAQFMEAALYEPGLGYYSAGLPKFGAQGDFVTAPELGRLFASCLAQQTQAVSRQLTGPWDVLELGAGSGQLAADFLSACTPEHAPQRYRILERSADLRAEQQRRIARCVPDWQDRVEWLDAPPAQDWQGVLLANEVLDALAVEAFAVRPDGLMQRGVHITADALNWTERPAPKALQDALAQRQKRLPAPLAVGYESELCLSLSPWLASVTDTLQHGMALFIDYGYPRASYYHPQRSAGTLVAHYQHRAHFDPFFWPGLQDLTAFVDFTALAEAADDTGLEVAGYCSQAWFLMACGIDQRLQEQAADTPMAQRALAHELRELTLPEAMGEKFQLMALSRGLEEPLPGFELQDLRGEL